MGGVPAGGGVGGCVGVCGWGGGGGWVVVTVLVNINGKYYSSISCVCVPLNLHINTYTNEASFLRQMPRCQHESNRPCN